MDERIKNALGVVGVIAMALLAVAALSASDAFSKAAVSGATFSVSGQGKVTGIPDVAQFTFSVVTQGGLDLASLQSNNTAKANAAVEFVKSQGVEAKDIETVGYDIQPRYQSFNCNPRVIYRDLPASSGGGIEPAAISAPEPCPPANIVGYAVTQTVQVKVRDFSKTGPLISGVTEKGANSVSNLSFAIDDITGLQNEARGSAIRDAKMQAESMARAGGFKLGRLVSVSEGGYIPFSRDMALQSEVAEGFGGGVPAPSIEPGSQQISSQVTLTYEIR